MDTSAVTLHLEKGRKKVTVPGVRVAFSAHQCFEGGGDEQAYLEALADHLMECRGLTVWGAGLLWDALRETQPETVRSSLGSNAPDAPANTKDLLLGPGRAG